jgi:hypothetical protein
MAIEVMVASVPEAARPAVPAMPPVVIPVTAMIVAMDEPMAMTTASILVMLGMGARAAGHQKSQAPRRQHDAKPSSHVGRSS